MASLSNDLESLSLNLPDVVAAAEAAAASAVANSAESSSSRSHGRRGRRNKANKSLLPSGNKDNTRDNFATPDGASAQASCLAPLEDNDQRVPDIDFSLASLEHQENNNVLDKSPWKPKNSR